MFTAVHTLDDCWLAQAAARAMTIRGAGIVPPSRRAEACAFLATVSLARAEECQDAQRARDLWTTGATYFDEATRFLRRAGKTSRVDLGTPQTTVVVEALSRWICAEITAHREQNRAPARLI